MADAPPTADEVDLLGYLAVLKRRKATLIAIVIASVAVTGFVSAFLLAPIYEARTSLIFQQPLPTASTVFVPTGDELPKALRLAGLGPTADVADPYIAIFRSTTIATRVVEYFGLQEHFGADTLEEAIQTLQDNVTAGVTDEGLIVLRVRFNSVSRVGGWFGSANNDAPQLAADVANYYVGAVRKFTQEEVFLHQATKYRAYLEGQVDNALKGLGAAEDALLRYQEEHHIVSLPDEIKAALQNMAQLEAEKLLSEAKVQELKARIDIVTRQIVQQAEEPLQAVPAHSPFVTELRQKLVSQESELALAAQEYGPEHPTVVRLNLQLEETQKQLKDEIERVLSSVESGLAPELIDLEQDKVAAEARLEAQTKILSKLKADKKSAPLMQMKLARLTRQVEVPSRTYSLLAEELERAKMTEAREVVNFQVLDRALPPQKRAGPKTLMAVALAAILGLFAGLFWVVFREYAEKARLGDESKRSEER